MATDLDRGNRGVREGCRRPVARRAVVAAVAAGFLLVLGVGGSPARQPEPVKVAAQPADPAAPASKKRLVFGLRTDASMKKQELLDLLTEARRYAEGERLAIGWDPAVDPIPITGQMYKTLEAFGREGGLQSLVGMNEGGTPRVESYPGQPVWLIDLGSPNRDLIELTLLDKEGKAVGDAIQINKGKLEPVQLGKYRLSAELKTTPAKYRVKYQDRTQAPTPIESVHDWPATGEGYWLIELKGWTGDLSTLTKVLTEGNFATPIQQVVPLEAMTLALVDLKAGGGGDTCGFSGNTFVFRFPLVRRDGGGKDVARGGSGLPRAGRVFVRFPLSKDEAVAEAKALNDLDVPDRKTRGEMVMKAILGKTPVLATDAGAKLLPDAPPGWFEVPAVTGHHERGVGVENIPGWKAAAKGRSWRVSVYERVPEVPGEAPSAIQVTHPDDANLRIYALAQEEPQWIAGIAALPVPPPPAPKQP